MSRNGPYLVGNSIILTTFSACLGINFLQHFNDQTQEQQKTELIDQLHFEIITFIL